MSNDKLAEALRAFPEDPNPFTYRRCYAKAQEALQAHAAEAAHPQPAQDASNPLKRWIFDKVNMGRGDERYICTPDGANATTVRNESTSDHRERLLWLIADAMVKESGR